MKAFWKYTPVLVPIALLAVVIGASRAKAETPQQDDFSFICDNKDDLEAILSANVEGGFDAGLKKYREYNAIIGTSGEASCIAITMLNPKNVGGMEKTYEKVELKPNSYHIVIVVSLLPDMAHGGAMYWATVSTKMYDKPKETGL